MIDPPALLADATTVLLIDWSHQEVPAMLIRAGFTVLGDEPDGHKRYEIAPEPIDATIGRSFPLSSAFLVCRPLPELPESIDIVNTFRPAVEHPEIAEMAVDAGARILWFQPATGDSPEAREIAAAAGLVVIDGVGIEQIVGELDIKAKGST